MAEAAVGRPPPTSTSGGHRMFLLALALSVLVLPLAANGQDFLPPTKLGG